MKENLILKIQGLLNSFLPAEKRVAEYVINNARDVIHFSITELAEKCGSSEATVIRFCRKLGFPGFQVLKINIAQELVSPLESIHEDITESDDSFSIAKKVYKANMQAINDSLSILDSAEFERAVSVLSRAARIFLVGVGGSGVVAKDAEHKFFKTGINVVAYTDVFMQTMASALAAKGDVVVGISHSGSTRSVVNAMRLAREAGATTISITQSVKSPITKNADIKLFVVSREVEYRDESTGARIAQLCLLDSLFVAAATRNPERTLDVLQKARLALAAFRY